MQVSVLASFYEANEHSGLRLIEIPHVVNLSQSAHKMYA